MVAGKARSMDAEVLGMAFENLGFDVVTHPMTTPVMVRVVLALQGVAAALLLLVLRLDDDDVRLLLLLRLEVRLLRLDNDDGGWLVLRLHDDYLAFVLVPEAGVFFEEVVHRLVSCNVKPEVLVSDEVIRIVDTLKVVETRVEQSFTGTERSISMEQWVVLVGMDPHDPVLVTQELLLHALGIEIFKRYGAMFASKTGVVHLEAVSVAFDHEGLLTGMLSPMMAGEVL